MESSQATAGEITASDGRPGVSGQMARRFRPHLSDPRFWIVQGLVVLATAVHWGVEAFEVLTDHNIGIFIVLMYAVYFVPVIYASLNFGREGAIPTALWAAMLALPPTFIWHHGADRLIDILQHLTIIALAVVIATRVDREVAARRETEREIAGRRISEAKYRGLFEAASEAIVVFDRSGYVREVNAAALELFEQTPDAAAGGLLRDTLGDENAKHLLRVGRGDEVISRDLRLVRENGVEVWLEPACSFVRANGDPELIQVLFRDVTEQRTRQRGLETYAQQIIRAQEEERRRIARDLHDGALQSLVLLFRQLDALETDRTQLPGSTDHDLNKVRLTMEAIADELRRFSRNLRPSILDDLGLAPAVRWLVNDLKHRTGLSGTLVVSGERFPLSADEELGLFRIAQEALHNVERHADASTVTVTLGYSEAAVTLTVQDDGKGISVADPIPASAASGNLGLLGMQERARLLGGTFEITASSGDGTRIHVSLPAPSSSND
jgi:PAS domain S-box-containing protein